MLIPDVDISEQANNSVKKPCIPERLCFFLLGMLDFIFSLIAKNYTFFLWTFRYFPPKLLECLSKLYAKRAYLFALKNVPAYSDFIDQHQHANTDIPETDKNNYIKKYSIESRCLHGKIPTSRVAIDESSGSTGIPYNWVRTFQERQQAHVTIRHFTHHCFGDKPNIVINAFSLGSWATGMNMGAALEKDYIVKNTGPDSHKIFQTLSFFGKKYHYLILGYPPFLKHLIDIAHMEAFDLTDFTLYGLVGGEGMSEGLRDYLQSHFKLVYSGYGATDIEIGMAGETALTVAIRRFARDNNKFREQLFGDDSRLPMVFQYNPLIHYIETNENGELIFTITSKSRLSPRIRYNLHDEGGICRFDDMVKALAEHQIDIHSLSQDGKPIVQLPFLWIFGRKDYTISIMGANIYPEDIEQIIYADPFLASITSSFCQHVGENDYQEVRPVFSFEINVVPSSLIAKKFKEALIAGLKEINADFREAWKEHPDTLEPEVRLYSPGEGPFKMKTGQIKQVRILKE